jgi:hypothetical protein
LCRLPAVYISIQYACFQYLKQGETHDENCDTLTFLSCSWQRCKLYFQYFFNLQTVNFLVFLLEEIGSDRAHCECMRRFSSFGNCFLQNW